MTDPDERSAADETRIARALKMAWDKRPETIRESSAGAAEAAVVSARAFRERLEVSER